ncbi:3-carboxy-cis,cis-muconate cycloisomerase [Amycolatopsis anabasis]|uniref:3-carboxy-cis,cis-muconate cycloisomerase n=1 Tax=Amycolatopsis anabasis TaxID=1840409 RepID=UPI00131DE9B7|nr:3-carboxy-cis,cis-muconate cycloisomerase [Amycolatopsis anabasis]
MSELFDGIIAAGAVRSEVSDAAWLRAMLDVESALAAAQADAGLVERAHAEEIARACRDGYYDLAELGAQAIGVGNPAAPLVREITAKVAGTAARYVHFGATSQDVVDTAAVLVVARALEPLLEDLDACAELAAGLAGEHALTVQVGRTLAQQAIPVTFGLTAAGWLSGLDAAAHRLRGQRLAVQLGGATGTLASLGERGPAVLAAFANRLGLAEPDLPWHTERTRIAEIAGALAETSGVVAGIAHTLTLLAQTEIAEVSEQGPPGSGGSSTMPHKRNPIASVVAQACARQAPGLAGTLFGAMAHEYQRAAGAWHAEWRPLAELLRSTGSAVHWLRTAVERLRVDPARMRENLDRSGGILLAERVTSALTPETGRLAAHDAVTACCRRALAGEGTLAELLAADPLAGKHLSHEQIEELLDPAGYLGSAEFFVRRALDSHRAFKETR